MSSEPDVVLELPKTLREDLKEPLGPVETDIETVLADANDPVIAVGDVVSYHCERVGRSPDVAVIDGRTKRTDVDTDIEETLAAVDVDRLHAENPAATLTISLLEALVDAIERPDPVQLVVDGEEDLVALPAILAAPKNASVLYGQPGEGVVHVRADAEARTRARVLLEAMDGDHERVFSLIER